LQVPQLIRFQLSVDPQRRGLCRDNKIELNKMIEFYRTQDLAKQFSAKVDLLATQNIIIQYDPVANAILITKVADDSQQVLNWYNPPIPLEPRASTITMYAGSSWVEPAVGQAAQVAVIDFFEEIVEDGEGLGPWGDALVDDDEDPNEWDQAMEENDDDANDWDQAMEDNSDDSNE
jgi:hypothetical protein